MSRVLILVVALLCTAVFSSHATAQPSAEDARTYFERGVDAYRNSRWREARILFQRSLEIVAKPSTLYNLAQTELRLGNGAEALEHLTAFEQVADKNEHKETLARVPVLRTQAQTLIDSEHSASQGNRSLAPDRPQTDDGLTPQVRSYVARGRKEYARGNDKLALSLFERAYQASQKPELLYNIAIVADRMREDARALEAYEAFATALPDAPETAVAQVRSTALRATLEERERQRAAAEAAAQAATPDSTRDKLPKPASLLGPRLTVVSGVILAGLSIGAIGWYAERGGKIDDCKAVISRHDASVAAGQDPSKVPTCGNLDVLETQQHQLKVSAIVLSSVAVSVTTAGIIWLVKRKSHRASDGATTKLTVRPELALMPVGRSGIGQLGLSVMRRF